MKVFARNFSLSRSRRFLPHLGLYYKESQYHNKRETFFLLSRDYGEKKFLWKFHQFKPYNRIFRNSFQSFQIAPWLFQPISCKWRNSRFWHNFTAFKNHENISSCFLRKSLRSINFYELYTVFDDFRHIPDVMILDHIFSEHSTFSLSRDRNY